MKIKLDVYFVGCVPTAAGVFNGNAYPAGFKSTFLCDGETLFAKGVDLTGVSKNGVPVLGSAFFDFKAFGGKYTPNVLSFDPKRA